MTDLIPAWVEGILQPVGKLDVHRRGLRHPAVSVFALRGDTVLIQRRASCKYHSPGLWANTCCTHPQWGEPPAVCAARRLREELGMSGLSLTYRGQVEYRADVGASLTEHEVVDLYVAEVPEGLEPRPDPGEVQAVRWIGLTDLANEIAARPDRFTAWLRIYLHRHAALIFGTGLPA